MKDNKNQSTSNRKTLRWFVNVVLGKQPPINCRERITCQKHRYLAEIH